MAELPASLQSLRSELPLDKPAWSHSSLPQAAVLVALSAQPEPRVLLGRRARHLRFHPGEIAFPGGKREAIDCSPWSTARREAHEETGLAASMVEPLGELPPLRTRTGFEVHPCVAAVPAALALQADPQEFDALLQQPLARFADARLFRLETMVVDGVARKVPHYQIGDDNVWGVTAAVLAMLANIAYDAGLDLQRNWTQLT
ncbi:CoA pyrophosphatase [Pseudohalioglobus sediminis]|uniref:CoA pyrophosphatase n=1 Tax=Pseudohalioglobus sediminis TaxID=2606449 RepID=A0A5B0X124_9GAMM|nr:CoA pyrophosphatase [Pseudohalioglobus sediminis]KAA1192355.1 CoA pyrophosphatase [Pseudohalioglobus sediminis]